MAAPQSITSLRASLVRPFLADAGPTSESQSLDSGWEYDQRPLDGLWEVWRGDEIAVWEKVSLPHCFNHYDACGVLCLDAKDVVRLSLAGNERLIDHLGTSTGSRVVQLYNGRAGTSIALNWGQSVVGVVAEGMAPAFVSLS